jgi:hypothetical protein
MDSEENLINIIFAINFLSIIRAIIQRPERNNREEEDEVSFDFEQIFMGGVGEEGDDVSSDFESRSMNNIRAVEDEVSSDTEYIFSPNLIINAASCNVEKQIIKSCMDSVDSVLIEILHKYGIHNYVVYSSVYDKIKNPSDFQMIIKDIYDESAPNQVRNKEQYKENKKQIREKILEDENNDPNKKIKALNAIFKSPYLAFLKAYLNDESKITIKNDINGVTKVYFTKGKINQDSSNESILNFNFDTYKDYAKYKYDKYQKIDFKDKLTSKTFLGKKVKRNNN